MLYEVAYLAEIIYINLNSSCHKFHCLWDRFWKAQESKHAVHRIYPIIHPPMSRVMKLCGMFELRFSCFFHKYWLER